MEVPIVVINSAAHKTRMLVAPPILLSALFLLSSPSSPQASSGTLSETLKVQVVSNLIVMPGYVNESSRLDVVLDTGAGENVLMPDRASELKLISASSGQVAGLGRGEDETMRVFSRVRLAWGDKKRLTLNDQTIAALPIGYVSKQTGHQVDGIFGSSLFQNFDVRVDYEHAEVTFSRGGPPATIGTAIPIKLHNGVPFVEAAFETASGAKVPALFLIDSGTSGELILSRKFLDAHPSVAEGHALVNFPTVTAVGGGIEMQDMRVTGLDLGPFRLIAPVAAVPRDTLGALANPEVAGFIGAGILSRFTVDWNYQHETVTLIPNHRYTDPFEADASGLRLVAEEPMWKTIRVSAISPGSPGAEAGLEVGDLLQSVDGKAPPPLDELTKLLSNPGAAIGITILRSGKQSRMTIHLRRLV
jgi:predicted aspartyl protease